ncbi:MAG: type II toxin-antitoxin system Y4mF family antitoxin [Gammaproteobacteria bacterium]
MNNRAFGRRIRATRRRQGLRQEELAALAGVGVRFISDLENGKAAIELGRCLRVAESLGLRLELAERGWTDRAAADDD